MSEKKDEKAGQKSRPAIKDLIINSGITYLIFVIGYLLFCSIQGLIKHGELGRFYIFGRHGRTEEITDKPVLIICYFAVLLLVCAVPNVIMYVRKTRGYKNNKK